MSRKYNIDELAKRMRDQFGNDDTKAHHFFHEDGTKKSNSELVGSWINENPATANYLNVPPPQSNPNGELLNKPATDYSAYTSSRPTEAAGWLKGLYFQIQRAAIKFPETLTGIITGILDPVSKYQSTQKEIAEIDKRLAEGGRMKGLFGIELGFQKDTPHDQDRLRKKHSELVAFSGILKDIAKDKLEDAKQMQKEISFK